MSLPSVIILQGLPASGKSTWAKERVAKDGNYRRVNKDSIRGMLGAKHSKQSEAIVEKVRDSTILNCLAAGKSVIVDDTNIAMRHINHIRELAGPYATVTVDKSFMDVPVEECIKRDAARKDSVGKDVIVRMYYQYWEQQEKPLPMAFKPAIMVDADGTLCLWEGGKAKAFDRDFSKDTVNEAVFETMLAMKDTHQIIIMSGRSGKHRTATFEWLRENEIPWHWLYMREEGDTRKDSVVKKELYMKYVHPNYNVTFVLDDRPQVVRMWRAELGLTVFHVAPDIEF